MTLFEERKRVLIVDDTPENICILVEILKDQYDVSVAINGQKALKIAAMNPPIDLILLDIMMPEMDGYEVFARLKANPKTANIPVIFVTALSAYENEAKGLEMGAVDYITKPFNSALVRARVKNHLELKNYRDKLEEMVQENQGIDDYHDVAIETLGSLAEYRNLETGNHIKRTILCPPFSPKTARASNFKDSLTNEKIENLWKSAPLHDIGKVGVPDRILLKPGDLTQRN